MKQLRDYECDKCQVVQLDIQAELTEPINCPLCGNEMTQIYTKMSFKEGFKGSHKRDYKEKK